MAILDPPLYLEEKLTPARFDRQFVDDVFQHGVVGHGALAPSSGGGLNISIAAGPIYVRGILVAHQGLYRVFNDAALLKLLDPGGANPRVDQIIVAMYDSAENNGIGPDLGGIEIIKGDEAAGATLNNRSGAKSDASINTGRAGWTRVCDVHVPAGFAGPFVAGTHIRDRRPWAQGAALITPSVGTANSNSSGYTDFAVAETRRRVELTGVPVAFTVRHRGQHQVPGSSGRSRGRAAASLFGAADVFPGENIEFIVGNDFPIAREISSLWNPAAGSWVIRYQAFSEANMVVAGAAGWALRELSDASATMAANGSGAS